MAEREVVRLNVEIPRDLWRRAKVQAAQSDRDLRDVVIEALEAHLGGKPKKGAKS